MNKPCCGSRDKSFPREVIWKTVPHKLFFAQSYTPAWGTGGVAFLNPASNTDDRAYVCTYRITYVLSLLLFKYSEKHGLSFGADCVHRPHYIDKIVQSYCGVARF